MKPDDKLEGDEMTATAFAAIIGICIGIIALALCLILSGCAHHYETEAHSKIVHERDMAKYQKRMDRSEHELAWWTMKRDLADFDYVQCWGYDTTTNMETNRILFNASFDRFIADEERLWMLEEPAEYHAYKDSRTNLLK